MMDGRQAAKSTVQEELQAVRVPGYVMLKVLGDGGQARVYKSARADANGKAVRGAKRVAIKVYHGEHARRAMQTELRCLASLQDHCNIVRLVGEIEGAPCMNALALELCEKDMQVLPFLRDLSEADVVKIMRGALSALEYMHSLQIVHRDVKPDNIAIVGDDTARLLDFGCAAPLSDAEEMSKLCGSLEFLAPEMFDGTPSGLPVDMFAYGATLFYVLGKQYPLATPGMTYEEVAALLQRYTISFGSNFDHVSNDSKGFISSLMHPCDAWRPDAKYALSSPPFACSGQEERHHVVSFEEQLKRAKMSPLPPPHSRKGPPRPTPLRKFKVSASSACNVLDIVVDSVAQ